VPLLLYIFRNSDILTNDVLDSLFLQVKQFEITRNAADDVGRIEGHITDRMKVAIFSAIDGNF
jgi:hypothetical protein